MSDVPLSSWVRCISDEYLDGFIHGGGSAIKFAVGPSSLRQAARRQIAQACRGLGIGVIDLVDSAPDVHSIDRLWFAIAATVDWAAFIDRYARAVLNDAGFPIDDPDSPATLESACEAFEVEEVQVTQGVQRSLTKVILRDRRLDHRFRVALSSLVYDAISGGLDSALESVAMAWLTGAAVPLADLKKRAIFRRIDRTNARDIIASFASAHARVVSPLCMLIETASYHVATSASGRLKYSRGSLIQLYEALREFVDEVDEWSGSLIVVFCDPAFVDDERRSYAIYRALQTRIANEVHSRDLGNPCSTLVRLVE